MNHFSFMDKLKSFLGLPQEPPRNDFRNPIWGDDDDDDGDELYERNAQINVYSDPLQLHSEITKQVFDIFKTFGTLFGEGSNFSEENFNFGNISTMTDTNPDSEENSDSNQLRNYYLKPGYRYKHQHPKEDGDLDGKISSQDISGLLKQRDSLSSLDQFDNVTKPSGSFFRTVITTSIKKPDGTVETRRITKNGNEVTEELTTTKPDPHSPVTTGQDVLSPDIFFNNFMSEFASRWRHFQ